MKTHERLTNARLWILVGNAQAKTCALAAQARSGKPDHKFPYNPAHGQVEANDQLAPHAQVRNFEFQIQTGETLLAQRTIRLVFVGAEETPYKSSSPPISGPPLQTSPPEED
jgi:hypothetical protein